MPIVKNIQMKMEFNEIQINCAKELVKGTIKSVWDEKTCAMVDLDELIGEESTGGKDKPSANAKLLKYPQDANTCPSGSLMVDDNGTVWFKTKDGKDVEIGKIVEFNSNEYQSSNFLSGVSHYIEFYNEDKVNNAFDNDAQGYYRKMVNEYDFFDSSESLILPWLANNPGKQKTIKAREVIKKTTEAPFESVQFVIPTDNGYIQLNSTKDDAGNYELQIPGLSDVENSTPIFAIARTSSGTAYFDAGKMMQANYAERTHKLIIVPTHEDYSADVTKIQEQLNAIYGRVGVTYTIEEDRSFVDNSDSHCILMDGLDISADKEGHWNVETKEMMDLRSLYENSHPNMDKKAAYLFLVNFGEYPYVNVEGDMPRNQSVGYVFMNGNRKLDDGRLVAHELGHGVYKFQHTFDYKALSDMKEKTDNLMDYAGGNFLAHYQWRVMQDSVMFVWKGLQDDEDGLWTTDGHFYLFTYLSMRIGNDYETALKYGKMSEEPDTEFKIENGVVRAFENNTWMIGGLQQLYHVLNDNFHGVQLAATTWAILNIDLFPDGEKYLYHRFGDAFAHINGHTNDSDMKNWNITIPLRQYYESIDEFLNDEISALGFNAYDEFGRKLKANLVYSIMATKNIPSLGGTSWGFMDLSRNLLNRLPVANQNEYRMFGQPAGDNDQATRGHAPNPGSSVDDILRHRELFQLYARNALELLSMKEQLSVDVESIMQDVDKIIRTTFDAIAYGNKNIDKVQSDNINWKTIDEGWKLDAIWNFHIHMLLMERENLSEITFTLPYKYLLPEKALDPRLMHNITITPMGDWNISFDSNTFVNEPGIAFYVVYDGWSSSDFNRGNYGQMIYLRRLRDRASVYPRFLRQHLFTQSNAEELRNLEERMAKSPYSKDKVDNQNMVVSGPVANCVKFLRSYLMLSHKKGEYINYDFDLSYSDENVQITVKRTK